MRGTSASIGILLAALAGACADEDAFTTAPGECFRGRIVGADFVRTGFDQQAGALLTIDVRALTGGVAGAGYLWTTDGIFAGAAVSQMSQISNDAISLFQFPGGRIRNYLAHAHTQDGAPAMLVISLMENDRVELRVIRPPAEGADDPPALFGVFRLSLDEQCGLPGEV